MNYIDLFAGAGGLSEGFIRAGFSPIAHVEMDKSACNTLKTRTAYHHLKKNNQLEKYYEYIRTGNNSSDIYNLIPENLLDTVINDEINQENLQSIFNKIDNLKGRNNIDLIIGGPPCQAYSLVGRARDPRRMQGDKRNYLFVYYAQFLKKFKPKYFVFENVTGLLTAGNYLNEMLTLFESPEVGYKVSYNILDSSEYGVLQRRKRVILIGKRTSGNFDFPFVDKISNQWNIKDDLFSDLPKLKPGQVMQIAKYSDKMTDYLHKFEIRNGFDFATQHITRPHNQRDLEIYKIAINKWLRERKRIKYNELPAHLKTHKNQKAFLDRFKVIDPFGLSHTLVAHIAKDGHYYIYPDLNQVRSISVREAARIQSFSDDYYFEVGRTAAFRQIGNAVPPLMAEKIAQSIKTLFKNI